MKMKKTKRRSEERTNPLEPHFLLVRRRNETSKCIKSDTSSKQSMMMMEPNERKGRYRLRIGFGVRFIVEGEDEVDNTVEKGEEGKIEAAVAITTSPDALESVEATVSWLEISVEGETRREEEEDDEDDAAEEKVGTATSGFVG
jgi:hypothetical protein